MAKKNYSIRKPGLIPVCIFFIYTFVFFSCDRSEEKQLNKAIIQDLTSQLEYSIELLKSKNAYGKIFPLTAEGDEIVLVASSDWNSGFYPGILWKLYEITGKKSWGEEASFYSGLLEKGILNDPVNYIGVKYFHGLANGYNITSRPEYREALLSATQTLLSVHNLQAGCICTNNLASGQQTCRVTIESLLNIELLFWATKGTGDTKYRDIAIQHILKVMKDHFQKDNSIWEVVNYDCLTGQIISKETNIGDSKSVVIAKDLAWALYGFTMAYRETRIPAFLEKAQSIADFIRNHPRLPADGIPYWNFDGVGIPVEERDASAAAIIAYSFFELNELLENNGIYAISAIHIMNSLCSERYLSAVGENSGFLLKNCTWTDSVHVNHNVPLVYADYFFLKAFQKKMNYKPN